MGIDGKLKLRPKITECNSRRGEEREIERERMESGYDRAEEDKRELTKKHAQAQERLQRYVNNARANVGPGNNNGE